MRMTCWPQAWDQRAVSAMAVTTPRSRNHDRQPSRALVPRIYAVGVPSSPTVKTSYIPSIACGIPDSISNTKQGDVGAWLQRDRDSPRLPHRQRGHRGDWHEVLRMIPSSLLLLRFAMVASSGPIPDVVLCGSRSLQCNHRQGAESLLTRIASQLRSTP